MMACFPRCRQGVHEGSASKAWVFQDVHEGSASGVPTWPIFQGVAKACQGVHEGSASKAWVFQYVHEGFASSVPTFDCSFGLFYPLAFDLEGCFFLVLLSACPVMAGLSKRFIQTFLSSGSCRQLLLEVSSFFVHCTKAL